jgi:hypothetical protein
VRDAEEKTEKREIGEGEEKIYDYIHGSRGN